MKDLHATGARDADLPVAISATRPQRLPAAAAPAPEAVTHDVAVPASARLPAPPAPMTQRDVDAALHGKRRARRFAVAALASGKTRTSVELRKLVGAKVRDVDGRQLGKIVMVLAEDNLADGWVVIEEGRGGRRYYLPADRVDGAPGDAWTSLHRDQVVETTAIVPQGRLTETAQRLLRRHYAPTITDRKHYSELVARERLVRRARAASAVQRASERLS
jgi:hypothetical protein